MNAKKVNVNWNSEMIEDLKAYHSIDAVDEIVKALSDEIDKSILSEIIGMSVFESKESDEEIASRYWSVEENIRAIYEKFLPEEKLKRIKELEHEVRGKVLANKLGIT